MSKLQLAMIVSIALSACAPIQNKQQLVDATDHPKSVPIGGAIATISKQKNLPNVFGAADIWGRKVDTGFLKLTYSGVSSDGGVILDQTDVDVVSNASVFTRMPSTYSSQSTASISSSGGAVYGQGNASAFAMAPHAESNIVLPPNVTRFTVPKGRTLSLSTGEVVEFLNAEPHQVTFRIIDTKRN